MRQEDEYKQKLLQRSGRCYHELRTTISKQFNLTGEQFNDYVNIPKGIYHNFEFGEQLPDFQQLQTMGIRTGVNLNWLVYGNGSMFGAREKDMEELVQYIEANETGYYEEYKRLLKLLQCKPLEELFFRVINDILENVDILRKSINIAMPQSTDVLEIKIEDTLDTNSPVSRDKQA